MAVYRITASFGLHRYLLPGRSNLLLTLAAQPATGVPRLESQLARLLPELEQLVRKAA